MCSVTVCLNAVQVLLNCVKKVLVLPLGSGYHLQDVNNDHVQGTKK